MGTRLNKRQTFFLILIGQNNDMSAIATDRPRYTFPLKIFLCRRGRNGRESRMKFDSPDHPDRWSPTVADAVSGVPI